MKKILFIALLFFGVYANAQKVKAEVIELDTLTTTERNALTVPAGKVQVVYDETIGDFYVNVKNGGWVTLASLVGGLQSTDIDTFAELDAIVADATPAKLGDNVSIFTNDAGYLTSSSLNSLSGNLLPSANNTYTIGSSIAVWSQLFAGIHIGNKFYWRTNYGGSGTNMNGDMVSSSLWSLSPNINSVSENMDLSYNYTANEWTINGDRILTTADGVGGSSPPFDDNSPHIMDNLDNTKTITIVADNITTATNRNLTMPDADVDLGNLGAANLDLTATFDWTGIHNFTNSVDIGDYGLITGEDLGVSGRRWWLRKGAVSENFEFLYQISDQTTAGGSYTTFYTLDETGVPTVSTDLVDKAYVDAFTHTDDQTASEVGITDAAGYYTGTDVEAMGQEIGSDLADRPTSLGTGRTNAVQYSDVFGQTLTDYNTDGAGGAGDLIIITNASPAEVVATATIAMDGWKMYDDQTADAATITLSDCDPGETLTVYINRASAPALAGTGLTFNQLPNTTAFASATTMMIIFEVAYDGTTIDYYYVER